MNGFERINSALNGERTDTTPIMLHNFMMAANELGVTMEQYRSNPRIIADCFINAVEKYKYDGILVDIDTVTLAGAVGVTVDFPTNEPARSNKGILEDLGNLTKLKFPKVEDYKYIQIWLEAVRLLSEYFKGEIYVRGNCDQAPFSLASMIRGSQNWMIDLMMAEENVITGLLEYCTEASLQFVKLMAQTGADMISNGDSPAGPEMVSPEMYEKYALPYEKELVKLSHKEGVKYALHICGNTETILDKMIKSDADAFELDYKTDMKKVFQAYSEKVTFIGNIDPSGVLALGDENLVRERTLELLDSYKKSNRFILNAGCALPSSTPSENIEVMIKTAREF